MQHSGQHFPTHGAMGAMGFFARGAAIGETGQQIAVQIELGHQRCLAVGIARHVIGPADDDTPVQLLDETWRQRLHGFIKQRLAGLLLRGRQTFGLELQLKACVGRVAKQQQGPGQQPGTWTPHSARMASARS
ncbi:hypothetical protein D3C76_965070 [compost metagenome]